MSFINQIDDNLINMMFSKEELTKYKEIAKKYLEASEEKYSAEMMLKQKLKGVVIGELKGIDLNYLRHGDTFYIAYKDQPHTMSLWDRIKFLFIGGSQTK